MTRDEAYAEMQKLQKQIAIQQKTYDERKKSLDQATTYSEDLKTYKGVIDGIKASLSSANSSFAGGGYTDGFKSDSGETISDAISKLDDALEGVNYNFESISTRITNLTNACNSIAESIEKLKAELDYASLCYMG